MIYVNDVSMTYASIDCSNSLVVVAFENYHLRRVYDGVDDDVDDKNGDVDDDND